MVSSSILLQFAALFAVTLFAITHLAVEGHLAPPRPSGALALVLPGAAVVRRLAGAVREVRVTAGEDVRRPHGEPRAAPLRLGAGEHDLVSEGLPRAPLPLGVGRQIRAVTRRATAAAVPATAAAVVPAAPVIAAAARAARVGATAGAAAVATRSRAAGPHAAGTRPAGARPAGGDPSARARPCARRRAAAVAGDALAHPAVVAFVVDGSGARNQQAEGEEHAPPQAHTRGGGATRLPAPGSFICSWRHP